MAHDETVEGHGGDAGTDDLGCPEPYKAGHGWEDHAVAQRPMPAVPLGVPQRQPLAVEQSDPIQLGRQVNALPAQHPGDKGQRGGGDGRHPRHRQPAVHNDQCPIPRLDAKFAQPRQPSMSSLFASTLKIS